MNSAVIERDYSGTFVGSSFMYATARDWAKFGLLYLRGGLWNGRRMLPEGWVDMTASPAPHAPGEAYGAGFWLKLPEEYTDPEGGGARLPPDAFHAVGHEGQFVTIIPSSDLVIVRLGLTRLPHAWPHDRFVGKVLGAVKTGPEQNRASRRQAAAE